MKTRNDTPLTVGDLLTTALLRDAELLAGGLGTSREVVDVAWWDGGEVPECGHRVLVHEGLQPLPPYLVEQGLRRAEAAGASAIVLAGAVDEPVLSTVRLAERLGLPLIAVSTADSREFGHSLAVLVRSPEIAAARQIESLVRRLRSRRRSPDAILAALDDVAGLTAAVIAADGSPLLGTPPECPKGARLDLAVPQQVPDATGTVLLQPVQTQSARGIIAWLVTHVPTWVPRLADSAADLLSVLEPAVAAWLTEERLTAEQHYRFRTQLLAQLVAKGEAVGRESVQQAVTAGWRLYGWHTGVHIGLRPAAISGDSRDFVVAQYARVREALRDEGLDGPLVEQRDGWSVWTTAAGSPPVADQQEVTRTVARVLDRLPAGWGAHAGVGRPHLGIAGIGATLGEARDAARLARGESTGTKVKHVDELGMSRVLLSWQHSADLRAYVDSMLAPIRRINGGQLLETLRTYLDNRSSVGLTAEALKLHRNTVTARLARIRELLDVDLDDPDERLAIAMACRIVEVEGLT
ncbi:helix-turn-helix domain-containing protein [Lentzea sp. NPDC059081]|uniref:helix-turn-helix domain-containing protein n=1 Tax=Lentzea sp. NPDC059081 TaxID=3346719 RepID=UPI0036A54142